MTAKFISRREALLASAATIAAVSCGARPIPAAERSAAATPGQSVRRRVLALYDGAIETRLKNSSVHSLAAMPLEWLGLTLEYHDINDGLPPVWTDSDCRGVLTWFPEPNIADYSAYVSWIERVAAAGLKIVQIDDAAAKPGSIDPAVEEALRRRLFAAFGVRSLGSWSAVTLGDQIVRRNETATQFECRFEAGLPPYELYAPLRGDATSWLVVTRADRARSQSHLIVHSPAGGFIAPSYAVVADPATGVRQWYVDPFAFFANAYAVDNEPAGDTTTLCGRRIYYSHIDGDGWRSVSQIRAVGRPAPTNAEVVLQSVIAANPDLPVTVAPIAAEMDPAFAGDLRAVNAARALFRLDQVEPASHTYTHPFRWAFFEHYSPESEAPFSEAYRSMATGQAMVVGTTEQPAGPAGCCARASRNGKSPPRAFGGRPFDLAQEIGGAAKLVDAVAAQPGKRVRLLQWPGDCLPFPAALRMAAQAGLLNINGGDTRCDQEFPSISAVAPIGFQRGGLKQIYASNSSEELYTDLWTDRFFGFRDLPQTWDRTGAPRRLKPMNLYYHMYSGERRASLDALVSNIAALRARGDYIGVFASQFAAVAEGFFSMKLDRDGPLAWRVRYRGALQTLRFPQGSDQMTDLASSAGVLGERVINGQLYVALDPAVAEPRVALTQRHDGLPMRPLLIGSSWTVQALSERPNGTTFQAQGFGPGHMQWRVPVGGRWTVRANETVAEVLAGSDGRLELELAPSPSAPVMVTMAPVTA